VGKYNQKIVLKIFYKIIEIILEIIIDLYYNICMIKGIIIVLIIGFILFAIFGIWGIIIPAVFFIAIIIISIKNANKFPVSVDSSSKTDTDTLFSFEHEINVSNIPVLIKYISNDESNLREVEIHKIGINGKNLYIRGFCKLRKDERTFRVDRINEMTVYDKNVNPMVFISELCKDKEEFNKCSLNGINFCLTGKLKIMTRRQAQERIEAFGGTFHDHIKYNTHYLVAENSKYNTSKLKIAKAHNIPIIDEETFIDYMSDPIKAQLNKPQSKDQYQFYKESVENNLDYKKSYVQNNDYSDSENNTTYDEKQPLGGKTFFFTGEFQSLNIL
jgi:hypothetical protein